MPEAISMAVQTQIAPINFDFSSSSPFKLLDINPNQWVEKCEITVTEVFDDPLATAEIGTAADPDLLLGTNEIDLTKLETYGTNENHQITVAEILRLILNPGTSTQGKGTIFLTIRS